MKLQKWLIVSENGSARITVKRPATDFDEIAISLNIELPDALFSKPQITACLTVPDSAAAPQEIAAEVIEDARQAIEQATGLMVRISMPPTPDGETA